MWCMCSSHPQLTLRYGNICWGSMTADSRAEDLGIHVGASQLTTDSKADNIRINVGAYSWQLTAELRIWKYMLVHHMFEFWFSFNMFNNNLPAVIFIRWTLISLSGLLVSSSLSACTLFVTLQCHFFILMKWNLSY